MFIAPLLLMFSTAQAVEYAEVLSMDTLLSEADEVVHGTVVDTKAEWGSDGLIYTRVTLDSLDTLSSEYRTDTVSFLVPGGRVDDVVLTIPGSPTFGTGQEYLVFLDGSKLLGLGQGAFRVEEGVARRAIQKTPEKIPVQQILGRPAEARGCSAEQLLHAFEDGWSLRRNTMLRLGEQQGQAVEVTLLDGLDYSISACVDGSSRGLVLELYDDQDRLLARAEGGGINQNIDFSVAETGSYWLVAHNEKVASGWTSAVDISIRYR